MLRQRFYLFVIVLMGLLTSGLAACSSQSAKTPAQAELPKVITYATMGTGSTLNTMAVAQANMLSQKLGINVTPEPTAGAAVIADLLKSGQADIAIFNSIDTWEAFQGSGSFDGKGKYPIRLVMSGEEGYYAFITTKATGAKTIADLKGKRIYAKRAGVPWLDRVAQITMNAVGLDIDKDVTNTPYESSAKTLDDIAQGKGVAVWGGLLPEKLAAFHQTNGAVIIPYEEAVSKAVQKDMPAFHPAKLPKDFPGAPKGTPVLGDYITIVARSNLSDDAVYTIVKTLIENRAELESVRAPFAEWNIERAVNSPPIPFHPGAIKYFKEKGVWNSELDKLQSSASK